MPAARRDLPRDGGGQAAAGGLLHRRPAAGAALAALPPGHARASRDLWSYGETGYHSLAAAVVKRALRARGHGLGLPHPRRRPALPHEVPARDRSRGGPRATSGPPSSTSSPAPTPRPTSTCSRTSRWTPSTTRAHGSTRGRRASGSGLGEPVRELPREFAPGDAAPPDVTDVRVFCGGCLVVGGPSYASRSRSGEHASPRIRPSTAGRSWSSPTSRSAPPRQPHELPLDHLHALRARGRHPRRRDARSCATTRASRRRCVIDARLKPWFPKEAPLRPRHRRPRDPALDASTSPPARSRWAIRKPPTSIPAS